MTEAASATCSFDEIRVEFVDSKVFAPKTLQDVPFEVTWKHIFMSSGYKVAWKNITLVECHEDGACLRLETTTQNFSCQQHAHAHPSPPSWLKCRKLVQHIWKKKQRKLEKLKQKEELLEHKNKKKSAANTTSWKRNTKSYSKRPSKFLMANQNNNQWDSDDDELDGVFNQGGHKKRRQEQEPVDLDEQLLQEQSAERAVEDVDLQEMEQERELQKEEEEPQDAGEAEFQDEDEPQEEEPSLDEEQELVQETTTMTPKARSKRRILTKKRPRIQVDSDDEDDLFAAPKVTTPGLQTRRIVSPSMVSPSLANLNRLDDDDDDTSMHNQDQEDEPEEPQAPEETEDPALGHAKISTFFNFKKKPPAGKMDGTSEPRFKSPMKPTATESPFQSPSNSVSSPCKELPSTKNSTNPFFAPRRPLLQTPKKNKSRSTQDTLESPDTSTVVPSTAESLLEDSPTNIAATPLPKKTPSRLEFEPNNAEEEDPIQDYDDDDTNVAIVPKIRVFARHQLRRRTYGRQSSSPYLETTPKKKDTATMALELTTPPRVVDNYLTRPPPIKCSWRGLRNLGNTCYMNASIQMLLSAPQFVQQLDPYNEGRRLVSSLCNLAQDLNDREQVGAATAKALKLAVDDQTDKFIGYQQRDAHEFLGDLLDKLHIELEGSKEKKDDAEDKVVEENMEEPAREEEPPLVLPTDEHFHLTVEVCLTCKSCGYARTKEEMYRYLSIDITDNEASPQDVDGGTPPAKHTVEKCLEQFFRPEARELKCEKCEEGQEATQTMRILSTPKAMLLHLKRFVFVEKEMTFQKNKDPVILSEKLSLDSFLKGDSDSAAPSKYSIQSIVHHLGNTADSGHYTADAVRFEGGSKKWISFDDGLTTETNSHSVLHNTQNQKTAYMLLYTCQ